MNQSHRAQSRQHNRGGTAVGFLNELDSVEAAAVIYLRLWCNGADSQMQVRNDFICTLGAEKGARALQSFEQLCDLCARHGRRPLMRHSVQCKCLGSDESCFANFIASAAMGEREDAMLIATLLVRADVAPLVSNLAASFGLALKQMHLSVPRDVTPYPPSNVTTLH
ncbi:hypothetical protein [Planktotalea sp.]|uniref:hypothetical protein n=1 Tax=Planktotalea sp. TaxID=2029877 RepID=UPI0032983D0A